MKKLIIIVSIVLSTLATTSAKAGIGDYVAKIFEVPASVVTSSTCAMLTREDLDLVKADKAIVSKRQCLIVETNTKTNVSKKIWEDTTVYSNGNTITKITPID